METDVLVLGGGIAGLATAHELRRRGYSDRIMIVERNNEVGGQARSRIVGDSNRHEEYSWRIYGPSYHTVRRIMKELKIYERLVDIKDHVLARNDGTVIRLNYNLSAVRTYANQFKDVSWSDKFKLVNKLCALLISSRRRLDEEYSEVRWKEYIPDHPDFQKYLVNATGPYLGVDHYKVSVSSVWGVAEGAGVGDISVLDGPTNEVWFNPWKSHLESQGVVIHTNTTALSMVPHKVVIVGQDNITKTISTKWTICALPVEELARIMQSQPMNALASLGHHWMVAVIIYFPRLVTPPGWKTGIHLPDSEWQLIIESQRLLWRPGYMDESQDLWSVGICDSKVPGSLVGKPAPYCSREEIYAEVLNQIRRAHINVPDPVSMSLWYSFQPSPSLDGEGKVEMKTWEPKFGPNAGTWNKRPVTRTSHPNVLIAGAHTRNSEEMILMDAAAESGVRAALVILKEENKECEEGTSKRRYVTDMTEPTERSRPGGWILIPLRAIDRGLYAIGLGQLPLSSIVVILYFILIAILIVKGILWLGS